jgi:hypothetical protein
MTTPDVREFIKALGDNAPTFFDTKPETIKRWIRTGNVPIKAAQKIFAALLASKEMAQQPPQRAPATTVTEPGIDPMTHLPINMDRRLPEIPVMAGQSLPPVIEISPTEQSFGNNFTRPSRLPVAQPPMVIRDDGSGNKIPVPSGAKPLSEQKNISLPPSIPQSAGWTEKKDEHAAAPEQTESVSAPQV